MGCTVKDEELLYRVQQEASSIIIALAPLIFWITKNYTKDGLVLLSTVEEKNYAG
jgi:hypothetical protein